MISNLEAAFTDQVVHCSPPGPRSPWLGRYSEDMQHYALIIEIYNQRPPSGWLECIHTMARATAIANSSSHSMPPSLARCKGSNRPINNFALPDHAA